jgi:hypothetical protein
MPVPNHRRWWTSGGFHGDDTESDGTSLTGPQVYSEEYKREFPCMLPVPSECGWASKRQ